TILVTASAVAGSVTAAHLQANGGDGGAISDDAPGGNGGNSAGGTKGGGGAGGAGGSGGIGGLGGEVTLTSPTLTLHHTTLDIGRHHVCYGWTRWLRGRIQHGWRQWRQQLHCHRRCRRNRWRRR